MEKSKKNSLNTPSSLPLLQIINKRIEPAFAFKKLIITLLTTTCITAIIPQQSFASVESTLTPFTGLTVQPHDKEQRLNEASLYQLMYAEFALDRGDIKTALKIYKEQAFLNNATAVFERALALSLKHEDLKDSLSFVTNWQQQNPQHTPAIFYTAYLALKAHDYKIAGTTLNKILENDPQSDLSGLLEGIYPESRDEQQVVLSTLQQLHIKHNPSLLVIQAGLLMQFGEYQLALQDINKALQQKPTSVPYITLKADILKQLGNPNTVFKHLATARKTLKTANTKSLYLYEIRYLLELQKNQQAWNLLLEAHHKFKKDNEITLLAALVSLDIAEYKTANKLLARLTSDQVYKDRANYYLGISAERQNDYTQARRYLKRVAEENLALQAQEKIVATYLLEDNTELAINSLEQFRTTYDIFAPESYLLQAKVLNTHGKTEQAKTLLSSAHDNYPNHDEITFAYANTLDNNNDYFKKYILLSQLYETDKTNPNYQVAFSELLLSKYPHAEHGIQLAQQVVAIPFDDEKFNSDIYIQGTNLLATSAYQQKQYTKVIDYLKDTYELLPTLNAAMLLLKSYQALGYEQQAALLLTDIQTRFNINPIDSQINDSKPNGNTTAGTNNKASITNHHPANFSQ
ncbi:MAG: hypothetical protein CSA42_03995 [Gammaproteobacteria bacterium]|nr:MAG: hypothetical protein CSA42_03995 [Gammaproteobacteria bacterium]